MAGLLGILAACNQGANRAPAAGPASGTTSAAPTVASQPVRSQATFIPAANPVGVNLTLEGCRNDGSPVITLPNGAGQFVCPDPGALGGPDSAYTSGNLGKGWNELDLVPYRIISSTGNSSPASQTYTVSLILDKQDASRPGYDVLSAPVLNATYSSASCVAAVFSDPLDKAPGIGGTDISLYRLVNITQARNTTCVYDYYGRLALGSHLYPGASLHANLANKELGTAGIGARDVSIPVKEIKPQELDKDMSASQGRDQVWDVTKAPNPDTLNFGDVCAPNAVTQMPVRISIRWEITNVVPGNVTLTTHVYATNPAARTITVNVTDKIYQGADQASLIDTAVSGPRDVPANTANFLMLTHSYQLVTTASLVGTVFNDVATATYTDLVTGVPVPGQTEAKASATVTSGTVANATASISDSESITGNSLSFAVAQPSLGSFSGYTAGTFVTGPVNWSVSGQSTNGGVDFNKTIKLGSKVVTSGTLSDTATLTGSDGFSDSASASVDISSAASVSLTINKTIPNVLQAGESQTFSFVIKSAGQPDKTASITFGAGETSKSVTLSNLDPGSYSVSEDAATGWAAQTAQNAAINLPDCAGAVTFNNTFTPARATVRKVTVPAGAEAGWEFTLSGPGTPSGGEKLTTTGAGALNFATPLQEGSYTVTETAKAGYDVTSRSADCTFAVNYPADANRSFDCVYTNTKRPTLKVIKVVVNDNGGTREAGDFTLQVDGTAVSSGAVNDQTIGQHTVGETAIPAGYALVGITGDCAPDGTVTLAAGDNKVCTITNTDIAPKLHLRKIVINDNGGTATAANFTLTADGSGSNDLGGTSPVDSGGTLQADTWALSETTVAGYAASGWVCVGGTQSGASISVGIGGEASCTVTNNDQPARLTLVKTVTNDHGGTALPAAFMLSAAGPTPISGAGGAQSDVSAGSYILSETQLYGYAAGTWSCVGGIQSGAQVSLALGQAATCTINNDDQPGRIVVVKNAKPANGSFGFTATGSGYSSFTLLGSAGGNVNTQTLNAGTYTVRESTQLGWILTGIGGSTDTNTPYNCVVTGTGGSSGLGDLNTQTATVSLKNGDTVTCTFENTGSGVTRTQGFWATHPNLALIAWQGGSQFGHTFPGVSLTPGIMDMTLCGKAVKPGLLNVPGSSDLMGAFWSGISKTSTNKSRSALDQARMQLLQQMIAAQLNASAFGSVPGSGSFAAWEAAYCGSNAAAISAAQQQAAAFNTAGDSGTFTPGTSAQSKLARFIANYLRWDALP